MMSANTKIDDLCDQVLLRLRARLDESGSDALLILIDPVLADPMDVLPEVQDLSRVRVPLNHPDMAPDKRPYLIVVNDQHKYEIVVNASVKIAMQEAMNTRASAHARSVCAWLFGQIQQVKTLARQLAMRGVIRDPEGQRRILRYWDPRAMQHVCDLYGLNEGDSGLAGVSWGLIDSFGCWQTLKPQTEGDIRAAPSLRNLRELGLMNAALQRLHMHGTNSLSADACWRALREGVQAGAAVGLSEDDDLAWFAADRVRFDRPLERSTQWGPWFAQIGANRARYTRGTADFDNNDWNTVLDGIPAHAHTKGSK